MADAFLDFEWEVATGYKWANADAPNQQWTLTPEKTPKGASRKRYKPLREHTGLFRMFAMTDPTPEGVLRFAQQFGLLRASSTHGSPHDADNEKETLGEWVQEVHALELALQFWDLARAGDTRYLAQHIFWWKDDQIAISLIARSRTGRPMLARASHALSRRQSLKTSTALELIAGDDARQFRRGNLIEPAFEHVRRAVNVRLEELTFPKTEWKLDRSGLRLSYTPRDLLGAIWLQFALAISQPKDFRTCAICGKAFEVSRDPVTGRRADSIFCSNPCKSRDYRARKREARSLHAKGLNVEDIARKIERDPQTVKRWIGARK